MSGSRIPLEHCGTEVTGIELHSSGHETRPEENSWIAGGGFVGIGYNFS